MFFILHTVPVASSADPKLIRNSVLLLPKTLDIQVVIRKSESGERTGSPCKKACASVTTSQSLKGKDKGLQEKDLLSRSAIASLLINKLSVHGGRKKLVVFLSQKSRHIVEACGRKEGCIK